MSGIQSTAAQSSGGLPVISAASSLTIYNATYANSYTNLYPALFGSLTFTCGLVAVTASWQLLAQDGTYAYLLAYHKISRTTCIAKVTLSTGVTVKLAELAFNANLPINSTNLVCAGIYSGNLWFIHFGANGSNYYTYIYSISCSTGATALAETAISGLNGVASTYPVPNTSSAPSGGKFALLGVYTSANVPKVCTVDVTTGAIAGALVAINGYTDGNGWLNRTGAWAGNSFYGYDGSSNGAVQTAIDPSTGAITQTRTSFSTTCAKFFPLIKGGTGFAVGSQSGGGFDYMGAGQSGSIGGPTYNLTQSGAFNTINNSYLCSAVEGVTTVWSQALVKNAQGVSCIANSIANFDRFDLANYVFAYTIPVLKITGSGKLINFEFGNARRMQVVAEIDGSASKPLPLVGYAGYSQTVPSRQTSVPLSFSSSLNIYLRGDSNFNDPASPSTGNDGNSSFTAIIGSGV